MKSSHARAAAFATIVLLLVTFTSVFAQNAGDRVRVVVAGDTLTGDVTETSESGIHGDSPDRRILRIHASRGGSSTGRSRASK